ncbi:MAG: DUF5654 family protein [Candidatus Diapherotrites archaeon]|nr:DUF5654 family protein [Candidatus Diapherotrites archaeon]
MTLDIEREIVRRKAAEQKLAKVKERFEMARKIREEFEAEFENRLITLLTTALGVVAALFWQTAIMDTIKTLIPIGGAWYYELLIAFIVTILAALSILAISRLPKKRLEKQ